MPSLYVLKYPMCGILGNALGEAAAIRHGWQDQSERFPFDVAMQTHMGENVVDYDPVERPPQIVAIGLALRLLAVALIMFLCRLHCQTPF